jgi:hypothetical protein
MIKLGPFGAAIPTRSRTQQHEMLRRSNAEDVFWL